MPLQGWRDTALWKQLTERGVGCESLRHYLASWLDDVETLLAKGGTAPLSFTLHDDEHSFRVAERMYDLLPETTLAKLSDLELGLLLSSAYLHDIGMNPRREVVSQIRDYLLSGVSGKLDPEEAKKLQRWLDEAHPGAQPPVLIGKPETERLHHAEFLTAFFCRHRHNDWSGDFIVEQTKGITHPPYVNWVQDLETLCKSHHYGLPRLMEPAFDLRLAGPEGKLVNLRYLAALLRVADILEFDPERTPQVVLTHRSPGPQSKVYWYKDHEISLALEKGSWSIAMQARTRDAWTHRAVQDTANGVDDELENCATMERTNAFLQGKKIDGDYYQWPWPARLARTIEPMPDTFVEIDGAFRPNAERILALLAGTQLYRTPLAAIRELLQNAFDAVKEQIASDLLRAPNPKDPRVQQARSLLHHVQLSLEENQEGELWLTCSDTGVGMTRRVIEKYLLVSGSQFRPEVLELHREAAANGLKLERSGEFGIGVLSYFMLADKMVIETRAAPGIELDQENHGWRFETEGLNSVGELWALSRVERGTLIKLRIKGGMADMVLGSEFSAFLDDLLVRTPCVFEFRHKDKVKSCGPGWAWQEADLVRSLMERRFPSVVADAPHPLEKKQAEIREELRKLASQKLRLHGPFEQNLPDDMGSVRIYVPYFDLDGGPSRLLFRIADGLIRPVRVDDDDYENAIGMPVLPVVRRSWRGFATSAEQAQPKEGALPPRRARYRPLFNPSTPLVVETDVVDQATISIDRDTLFIKEPQRFRTAINDACSTALKDFAKHHANSPYVELTLAHLGDNKPRLPDDLKSLSGTHWMFPANAKEDEFVWRRIAFPALMNLDGPGQDDRLTQGKAEVGRPYKDEIRLFEVEPNEEIELFDLREPSRLLICKRRSKLQLALLFEEQSALRVDARWIAEFPEDWAHVVAINYGSRTIYNRHSPLARFVTNNGWREYIDISQAKPRPSADGIARDVVVDQLARVAQTNAGVAAAFILGKCDELTSDEWQKLKDAAPPDWMTVFALAGLRSSQDFVVHWNFDREDRDGYLLRLSIDGVTKLAGHVEPGDHFALPLPKDPRWLDFDKGHSHKK
jgi:hypothetical protein